MRTGFQRHRLFAMVSPLLVWALHFVLAYSLVGLRCGAPPAWLARLDATALAWWLGALTLAALLAIAAIARHGWRSREAGHADAAPPAPSHERERFVGTVMLLLALLATIAVLFTTLPMLMLEPCR